MCIADVLICTGEGLLQLNGGMLCKTAYGVKISFLVMQSSKDLMFLLEPLLSTPFHLDCFLAAMKILGLESFYMIIKCFDYFSVFS